MHSVPFKNSNPKESSFKQACLTLFLSLFPCAAGLNMPEEDVGRGEVIQGDDPYMPSFLSTPTNVSFLSGEEAVLQCAIENRGTRTEILESAFSVASLVACNMFCVCNTFRAVVWKRASEPTPLTIGDETFVGDRRMYVNHRKHSLEWNLHIRHATPEDSGVYECHVITKSRDVWQMILLHVEDVQYVPTYKPEIQISGNQFVEKGNTLSLTCNATGFDYPPDELDWFKDGLKLIPGPRLKLTKDVSGSVYLSEKTIVSTLTISRAVMGDAGTYVCRASDMQVTSAKVNVLNTDTVNEKRGKHKEGKSSCSVITKIWNWCVVFLG
ncbi:hypothetical protein BaRGS_00030914 [Batillaria attramentaria]|uniref:Ig-like domain-containing protein n=1 Tax=Batillaria attramentaria TaxID=370345 RepID=A0ABD0JSI5_9CAEN